MFLTNYDGAGEFYLRCRSPLTSVMLRARRRGYRRVHSYALEEPQMPRRLTRVLGCLAGRWVTTRGGMDKRGG